MSENKTKVAHERLKAMRNKNEYVDIVRLAYGEWSIEKEVRFLSDNWLYFPDALFYEHWTSAVSNERGHYDALFRAGIIKKVMKVKAPYVDKNPKLLNLLDSEGYLTVYHGHSKKTLRGSNSWTVNRNIADWFGRRNADGRHNRKGESSGTYRIFTGKVKLTDVIAFITERDEDEIVVLNKNVVEVGTQEYPFDPNQSGLRPPPMFPAKERL